MKVKYNLKDLVTKQDKQFSIDYEDELNQQQYEAVVNTKGPQLVIAGAGTGKTRTLVYRVAYLVENGVDPQTILLLTFTRKAAKEMMNRASNILDNRCLNVSGGTFHSFANTVLRKYAQNIGYNENFTIIDRSDAEDIIDLLRGRFEYSFKKRRFPNKKTVLDVISKSLNTHRSYEDILTEDYPKFFEEAEVIKVISEHYQKYKQKRSIMDYDDLLVNLRKLLQENSDIRKELSLSYKYIMVDEYQDTNKLQAHIVCLLASEHENIVVVGDDSQSIYSFRGADFRNIMDFPKLFPNCRICKIEQNYRSTQPILSFTNAIIENAKEKYSKELFSQTESQQKPVFIRPKDEHMQAVFICQRILELREENVKLDDIAVLFRAAWHSNELEIQLGNHNIPFVKHGGIKFVETAHIKDIVAHLRIAFNPFDSVSWYRILRLINGIGSKYAESIIEEINADESGLNGLLSEKFKNRNFSNQLKKLHDMLYGLASLNLSPAEQIREVRKYYLPILEDKYDDSQRRAKDIESLEIIAEQYNSIEEFLTETVLEPPEASQAGTSPSDNEQEELLVLSTVHSAKGLEWHTVFVINLVDGYFPSTYSLWKEEDIEEERRLFYVATTRAKRNLYLLSQIESKSNYFLDRSRFIDEIDNFDELTEEWVLATEDDEEESDDSDLEEVEDKSNDDLLERINSYFEDT